MVISVVENIVVHLCQHSSVWWVIAMVRLMWFNRSLKVVTKYAVQYSRINSRIPWASRGESMIGWVDQTHFFLSLLFS